MSIGTLSRVGQRPGEAEALARHIKNLADDRPKAACLGKNARNVFERRFSKTRALAQWRAVIAGVT